MSRLAGVAAGLALVLAACGGAASSSGPGGSASVATAGPTQSSPPLIPSSPPSPVGTTVSATVTRVADGQTIEVSIGGESAIVRYLGIEIPISTGPMQSGPTVVQQATVANSGLVARQTVILELDASEADAAGRLLRYVWVENGGRLTLVNLALVSLGLARVATSPPDLRYDDLLHAAEQEARDAQRGLWAPGQSMPTQPIGSAEPGPGGSPSPTASGGATPAATPAPSDAVATGLPASNAPSP